jgi:hypothetical protein
MINTSIDQVDKKLSANIYAGGILDYATFGLAAAFGVKAAHGTKLAIGARNLATGAGIAYTGRSLFASNDVNTFYLNTESNLICVANRGNGLMAAYDQAANVKAAYDPASNTTDKTKLDIILVLSGCDPSKDTHLDQKVINDMLASNATMGQAIATVKSLDGTIAVQLNSASTNIIATLNSQLSAKEPSPQAILHAGAEANAIATNIVEGGNNPVPKGRDRTQCQATNQEISDFKTQLDGAVRAIIAELNAIGDLKDGCAAVASVPVSPLSVSPASLTIKQGSNSTLVILGGRSPFTVSWDKASQPTNIDDVPFQVIAGTTLITISAAANAKLTTKPYKLHVSDSSAVTSTADVSIEVVSQKQ